MKENNCEKPWSPETLFLRLRLHDLLHNILHNIWYSRIVVNKTMTKDYNKNNFAPQIKIKSTKIASSLLLMSINWRQRFIVTLQENIDDNSCYLGIQTTIASDKKKPFSPWSEVFQ